MPPILVRKKYGYTASASKGSNRAIASSKADWGAVRDGSFIVMSGDDIFYKIIGKKKFVFQKNVDVISNTQLKIEGAVGAMIGVDDDIEVHFNEHNVISAEIHDAGEGYEIDDILTLEGGICKYNSIDQIDVPAQVKVTEVNEEGGVLSLELVTEGIYSVAPEDFCDVKSDLGTGATLDISSRVSDVVSVEGRTISQLEINENDTIIHLNHPLPPRNLTAAIKVNKWELTLSTEYAGEDKISVNYEIIKDFTPFCNLPLIHGQLSSSHILYNEAMAILDKRLKDIEDKL